MGAHARTRRECLRAALCGPLPYLAAGSAPYDGRPGQHVAVAQTDPVIAGALWLVDEGGLSPALSRAVWAGFRRPRGNLVAQSLAAHGGTPLAATLKGRRITRIAVHPHRQREGIGRALIREACGEDYLSVSFGFTDALWHFWQQCGFELVRMGSHREASSGCYTAMALLPQSEAGHRLCEQARLRLHRDARVLSLWNGEKIPVADEWEATLNSDDWLELAGFAFAHRPFATSVAALTRLLLAVDLPLPALRGKIEARREDTALSAELSLTGRKAVLARLRAETAQALECLDNARSQQLKSDILQWQFFNDFFSKVAWSFPARRRIRSSIKETAMKHDHFVVQSPDKPAKQLLLLFHGVGDNAVNMGEIGRWFAPVFLRR